MPDERQICRKKMHNYKKVASPMSKAENGKPFCPKKLSKIGGYPLPPLKEKNRYVVFDGFPKNYTK